MDDHTTPGDLLDNYDLIVKYVHAIHLLKLLCMNAHIETFDAKTDTPLGRRALYMDRRIGYNDKFYFLTDFMSGVNYLNKVLQRLRLTPIRIQEGYAATEHASIPDQVQKVNHLRRALGMPVVNLLEDAAMYGNWEIGPDQLTLSELLFELIFRSIYSNAIAELVDPDEPTAIVVSDGHTEVDRIAERFSLLGQSHDFAAGSGYNWSGRSHEYGNHPPEGHNTGDVQTDQSWWGSWH